MIPLSDENPTRSFPIVTIGLIAANVAVFVLSFGQMADPEAFFSTYGLIPARLTASPVAEYPHVFTAMFLHGGFMHLAGNMLYLWIFGNNIEDALGKLGFLLFYLVSGVLAALGHVLTDPGSPLPMVGASGAIAGVLGAYMVLYPAARVKTLIFLGFFMTVARIPAWILLGLWILLQVGSSLSMPTDGGGVAWFAHIGGFVVGAALIHPFRKIAA